MNLMVMAGTADGAELIRKLKNVDKYINITATTVTDYGAEIAKAAGADKVVAKPLSEVELTSLINNDGIDILADATHPFAAEATINAIKACEEAGIIYLRLERPATILPESPLIHLIPSFSEAAYLAQNLTRGSILHLAGVSTLHYLTKIIDPHRVLVRIVPSIHSLTKCLELGIPGENIIAMQGIFSAKFNRVLMREFNAEVVVTKDSGERGGTPSKIEAALVLGVPIIVVQRPEVPELDKEKTFYEVDGLFQEINHLIKPSHRN